MRRPRSSSTSQSRHPFIEPSGDGASVRLKVRVQPRASRSEIAGEHNGALKIKLTAPPVDGEANSALVEFLSKTFKTAKKNVSIVSGHTSREKVVIVAGVSAQEAEAFIDVAL